MCRDCLWLGDEIECVPCFNSFGDCLNYERSVCYGSCSFYDERSSVEVAVSNLSRVRNLVRE